MAFVPIPLTQLFYFIFITNIFLQNITNSQTYCFWPDNNDLTTNTAFFGEYKLTTEIIEGAPVYEKLYENNCAYGKTAFIKKLYIGGSYVFAITETLASNTYYIYCSNNVQTNALSECDHKWIVYSMSGLRNIRFYQGTCPQLTCPSIILSAQNSYSCSNLLMNKIGKNTYQGGSKYLHYNIHYSKWLCYSDLNEITGCSITYNSRQKNANWYQINDGSSTSFDFEYSQNTYSITFFCHSNSPTKKPTKSPSKKPTKFPTKIPTTQYPTDSPTKLPTPKVTVYPTIIPTLSPSLIPTKLPSHIPTFYPTKIPTLNPTIIPTKIPTKIPTQIPTTLLPTVYPTNIPTNNPTTVIVTDIPTIMPTKYPTNIMTTKYIENTVIVIQESFQSSTVLHSLLILGIVTVSLFLCCICLCCIKYILSIYRMVHKTEQQLANNLNNFANPGSARNHNTLVNNDSDTAATDISSNNTPGNLEIDSTSLYQTRMLRSASYYMDNMKNENNINNENKGDTLGANEGEHETNNGNHHQNYNDVIKVELQHAHQK